MFLQVSCTTTGYRPNTLFEYCLAMPDPRGRQERVVPLLASPESQKAKHHFAEFYLWAGWDLGRVKLRPNGVALRHTTSDSRQRVVILDHDVFWDGFEIIWVDDARSYLTLATPRIRCNGRELYRSDQRLFTLRASSGKPVNLPLMWS